MLHFTPNLDFRQDLGFMYHMIQTRKHIHRERYGEREREVWTQTYCNNFDLSSGDEVFLFYNFILFYHKKINWIFFCEKYYSCNTTVRDRILREDTLWNSSSKDRICLRKQRSSTGLLRKITIISQFSMEEHFQDNLAPTFVILYFYYGSVYPLSWESRRHCG